MVLNSSCTLQLIQAKQIHTFTSAFFFSSAFPKQYTKPTPTAAAADQTHVHETVRACSKHLRRVIQWTDTDSCCRYRLNATHRCAPRSDGGGPDGVRPALAAGDGRLRSEPPSILEPGCQSRWGLLWFEWSVKHANASGTQLWSHMKKVTDWMMIKTGAPSVTRNDIQIWTICEICPLTGECNMYPF